MPTFTRLLFFTVLVLGLGRPAGAQTVPFAKGADVSWVTQMEASNYSFYTTAGVQKDLFQLLHDDYNLNTVRLRVWVNPAGGWNGKADVLAKALRAQALGQRLLIDFHYSDDFADPGKQTKPAAWQAYTVAQLKQAVYDHTTDVLSTLKANNITPEWVQVGNETNDGMLWPEGRISQGGAVNFAQFIDQGYQAVKAVSPTTKVVVHIANGYNNATFRYIFDALAVNGAHWDVIGLSLYPSTTNWPTYTAQCLANMNDMVGRYPGKEVMVVETGMPAAYPIPAQQMLLDLIAKTRLVAGGKGLGVLYWEPQAYNWMGYALGAWGTDGRPTAAMDAFLDVPPAPGLVYNPGFEYTGATPTPLGWSTASAADADADYTEGGSHSGFFRLTHYKATAYQVRTYQLLSNLPNGTYTLSGWVTSGGGQNSCQLYANGFGGGEKAVNVPQAVNFTQIQVPGIVVTNGQCEIGLRSDANAGNYCSLDDVTFTASQALATVAARAAPAVQLYPNPTAGPYALAFALDRPCPVRATLLTLTGQVVRVLADEPQLAAGPHVLALGPGAPLPPGAYLVRLACGDRVTVQKLIQL
ncbi:glycosyl hydrolase 53 family protein [Hymenobacter caeli]|uniref:Arabinogalactan endo-1,4-beta-galactosidase n=1 Tax=Hymenobacter caeli TaxID=2735894 RepID=A0ABX2FV57_9BACT|nr:glycosyl hydrolase 53 family protein [Hymenobacter caeli]NRT21075.1 arabinogalactan endo-1,4-beta-galactosidase [Hymenobacter caeli]